MTLYLTSRGHANTLQGDGALADKPSEHGSFDRFVFDPRDPVPTHGGAVCCNPRVLPWGPMDQRDVERRKDVLVYSTKPLSNDVEVIGPVRVVLYAATSAKDTDFTAKLVDVLPDGYARNLTDGILRLRYRESLERPQLAAPGAVYEISIDAGVTSNVFLRRSPHPPGDFEQQLPPLRPQPQHRRPHLGRNQDRSRQPNRIPRP